MVVGFNHLDLSRLISCQVIAYSELVERETPVPKKSVSGVRIGVSKDTDLDPSYSKK